mmetsp:Transcript_16153/g.24368  ORF Transcript_16153/g.24368 Transcript_16153/m.24368 type:complete len:337 (-) Transcript_16153:101-1111(-)|eukprot:CAMPEP_0167747598 /NCGR_PEP_ID=MMETSP0110_2-20121227/4373_1 /TAXON_ID=629695 /ORGANISM="Gymnochlora sp., Strain CCMP2014" /LENGTH=336 /DNA_ID=CAMNT_0007632523 /DNA_START=38 /DNA_END=1048 /DNA_ORIENTATION=-
MDNATQTASLRAIDPAYIADHAPSFFISISLIVSGTWIGSEAHRIFMSKSEETIRSRIKLGYVVITLLCIMMVSWILTVPGSCRHMIGLQVNRLVTFERHPELPEAKSFMEQFALPSNIITKYFDHALVCFTHVLPAAVWSAIIPFQLHPASRSKKYLRAIHRWSGRLFLTLSMLITFGFLLIENRGLSHYQHDYPEIPEKEASSLLLPDHIPNESFWLIIAFMITGVMSWWSVISIWGKRRDFKAHQRWIIRHCCLGLGVAVQRIYLFALAYGYKEYEKFTFGMKTPGPVPDPISKAIFGDAGLLAIFTVSLGSSWVISEIDSLETLRSKKLKEN